MLIKLTRSFAFYKAYFQIVSYYAFSLLRIAIIGWNPFLELSQSQYLSFIQSDRKLENNTILYIFIYNIKIIVTNRKHLLSIPLCKKLRYWDWDNFHRLDARAKSIVWGTKPCLIYSRLWHKDKQEKAGIYLSFLLLVLFQLSLNPNSNGTDELVLFEHLTQATTHESQERTITLHQNLAIRTERHILKTVWEATAIEAVRGEKAQTTILAKKSYHRRGWP